MFIILSEIIECILATEKFGKALSGITLIAFNALLFFYTSLLTFLRYTPVMIVCMLLHVLTVNVYWIFAKTLVHDGVFPWGIEFLDNIAKGVIKRIGYICV